MSKIKKQEWKNIMVKKEVYLGLKKLALIRKDEKGNPMKLSELVELLTKHK